MGEGLITMNDRPREAGGARFFDRNKRDRGWASAVTRRDKGQSLSSLTVIDVIGAESELVVFLTHLDRSHLVVRESNGGGPLYKFRWASGYANGEAVRIQGVLDAL
jgi:hypothetical protein